MNKECNLITPENIQGELINNEIEFNNLKVQAFKEQKYNELLKENQKLKKRIEEDKEDISSLMNVISKNCSELKCTSDEWLVIKLWQDMLGGDVDDEKV